jgi:hypothetical protein
MHIHACFHSVDVLLNKETADIIDQPVLEDDSITTPFDLLIHSIICTDSDVYNAV